MYIYIYRYSKNCINPINTDCINSPQQATWYGNSPMRMPMPFLPTSPGTKHHGVSEDILAAILRSCWEVKSNSCAIDSFICTHTYIYIYTHYTIQLQCNPIKCIENT